MIIVMDEVKVMFMVFVMVMILGMISDYWDGFGYD